MFNLSITRGIPSVWKAAHATLLYKGGDGNYLDNNRPISKSCCLGKILEILVNNQLISFKSALSLHQSGFRANHNFSYCISCKQYFIRFGQWDTLCCPFYRSVKSISCRWSCFGLTEAMQYILIERLVIGFRIICLIDFSVWSQGVSSLTGKRCTTRFKFGSFKFIIIFCLLLITAT